MKTLSELMTDYRAPLLEAWDTEMHTAKKDKGMFKGKGKGEIGSALSKNKKTAADDRAKGKAEPASLKKKIKQEEFALRAKNNFGKVSESIELREGAGLSFEHLLKQHHADVDTFIETDELTDGLFDTLYEYYFDEMPYGVAKARTGDPHNWIAERFSRDLQREGLIGDPEAEAFSSEPNAFGQHPSAMAPGIGESKVVEGKTMRKCKGKGCKKTCPDGKEFCCAACKKSVGVKESYGPFSKKGHIVQEGKASVNFPMVKTFDDYHEIDVFLDYLKQLGINAKGKEIGFSNGDYIGVFWLKGEPMNQAILSTLLRQNNITLDKD